MSGVIQRSGAVRLLAGALAAAAFLPGMSAAVSAAVPAATPTAVNYLTGPLRMVGINASGQGPNGLQLDGYAISPGGTMVAFWSNSTNLYSGAVDGYEHLYVADLATGTVLTIADTTKDLVLANDASDQTTRVVAWAPPKSGEQESYRLIFTSFATNLAPIEDPYSGPWLFMKDLVGKDVSRYPLKGVYGAQFAPDGKSIAFVTNYHYENSCQCVINQYETAIWQYLLVSDGPYDLFGVSADSSNVMPNTSADEASARPMWSPNGRYIAFESTAALVPQDTNGSRDIYVRDLTRNQTTLVTVGLSGMPANNASWWPMWSPNGEAIAFASDATNLVTKDTNSSSDVFVASVASGLTTRVSLKGRAGQVLFDSDTPVWSPDGKQIAFQTRSNAIVPSFLDSNVAPDIVVRTLATGATKIASVTAKGVQGSKYQGSDFDALQGPSWAAWSKSAGIVFRSNATTFSSGDSNGDGYTLFLKKV